MAFPNEGYEPDEPIERRYSSDVAIARLEVQFKSLQTDVTELKNDFVDHKKEEQERWDKILDELAGIKRGQDSVKGFVGGCMWIISSLAAGIALFKDQILSFFK